ncbi:MAG: TetR/AcrR family transcriptional regulator [Deltaproteobacteria bacterium]
MAKRSYFEAGAGESWQVGEGSSPAEQDQGAVPKIKNPDLVKTRRAQVCRAAEDLFAQKGYHKTSVRDIAKKAGISIGSLYGYIENKEDILRLLCSEFLSHLRSEVIKVLQGEKDVVRQLEGTVETMLRVVDRFQEYVLFTYRDSKYLKKQDLIFLIEQDSFFVETFAKIIEKGVEEGVFRAQQPEIVSTLLSILTHSWALKRYTLKKYSLYMFQKTLIQFVLNGLLKHQHP